MSNPQHLYLICSILYLPKVSPKLAGLACISTPLASQLFFFSKYSFIFLNSFLYLPSMLLGVLSFLHAYPPSNNAQPYFNTSGLGCCQCASTISNLRRRSNLSPEVPMRLVMYHFSMDYLQLKCLSSSTLFFTAPLICSKVEFISVLRVLEKLCMLGSFITLFFKFLRMTFTYSASSLLICLAWFFKWTNSSFWLSISLSFSSIIFCFLKIWYLEYSTVPVRPTRETRQPQKAFLQLLRRSLYFFQ